MTSTDMNLGLPSSKRPSSRVLKPPGGGHSNIFCEPEVTANPPRPKYDQQNSSNLNFVMNTVDPNIAVQKTREEILDKAKPTDSADHLNTNGGGGQKSPNDNGSSDQQNSSGRVRVPPGGFSSGLW